MIHLSQAALKEIKRLKSKHQPNAWFRLIVKTGGCSGFFYDMTFDETLKVDDRVFDCQGISVVVDSESWSYVKGLTVDYSEDLMGGGFRFHNPQAISSCSCGNSFAVETKIS